MNTLIKRHWVVVKPNPTKAACFHWWISCTQIDKQHGCPFVCICISYTLVVSDAALCQCSVEVSRFKWKKENTTVSVTSIDFTTTYSTFWSCICVYGIGKITFHILTNLSLRKKVKVDFFSFRFYYFVEYFSFDWLYYSLKFVHHILNKSCSLVVLNCLALFCFVFFSYL